MKNICPDEMCTGCFACANACPKQCIIIGPDKMGYLYPEIDQSKCIDCGLCQKICPNNHVENIDFNFPQKAFAAWALDENEYKTSTSGGAAAVFSRYILEKNGIVYGCASGDDFVVSHIEVSTMNELECLKGSKYVQSNIGDIYRKIKIQLAKNRLVLFIGTPCQVSGLISF